MFIYDFCNCFDDHVNYALPHSSQIRVPVLRLPTTVTAKQKVTAKRRKGVGQRLLFAFKIVCRVTVTVTVTVTARSKNRHFASLLTEHFDSSSRCFGPRVVR